MRRILVALTCALTILSAQAQVPAILMPSPLGVALTVGKWIYDGLEKVYYIEVAGEGTTLEESKLNGFRIAVEQAVGSVIASETEVNNNRITRDEIISYASGYVDRYEVVSQAPSQNGYRTVMKVWIKRSSISNRLLHTSPTSTEINGDKASTTLSTLQYERAQGDRLADTVINDFYRLGLNIQSKNPSVMLDDARNGVIVVPFVLAWNDNYIESLQEVLKRTAQDQRADLCMNVIKPCDRQPFVTISRKYGFDSKVSFSDTAKVDKILNTMVKTRPTIKMTIYTPDNRIFYHGCYNLDQLNHDSGYDVLGAEYFVDSKFYGAKNAVINSSLKVEKNITLSVRADQLKYAGRVELQIIPASQCPR